jgi:hypothetical protein
MRDLINLIEQSQQKAQPLVRAAFLYLPPTGDKTDFAQCGSCTFFMPGKQRCSLFGAHDKVVSNASCGLYVQGKPHDDQKILNKVTPENAGYNLGQVRCENCNWLDGHTCTLFKMLSEKMPDVFDLDPDVDPHGCCNAWQGEALT